MSAWTEDEKAYIKSHSMEMSDEEMRGNLVRITGVHRSLDAVKSARRRMGIYKNVGKKGIHEGKSTFLFLMPTKQDIFVAPRPKKTPSASKRGVKKKKEYVPTPLDLFRAEKKRMKQEERERKEQKDREDESFGLGGAVSLEGG